MRETGWEYDRKELEQFLSDKSKLFLSTRKSFLGAETVGLGSIPMTHPPYSWMAVLGFKPPDDFEIMEFFSTEFMSVDEYMRIITIPPVEAIVSVYARSNESEFDRRLLRISDRALQGGFAHEFAEAQIHYNMVPDEYSSVIGRLGDQTNADVLAALHGYGREVSDYLTYRLGTLRGEVDGFVIKGIKDRISILKESYLSK